MTTTYYYKHGRMSGDDNVDSCAKKEIHKLENGTKRNLFYVKYTDGHLYNPFQPNTHRRNTLKWLKVKEETFDFYVRFIKTGRLSSLRYAERSV